ncbi:DUF4234 domain-containing protein [Brachyspira hyodysenteriae]|uniref:DUF4234 domain-containing protein n=1 Tax=Brachyspira hyodysenteriae TaxID=159 RepID=UPI0022CD7FE4|nr:DUF4234 domain-containing protein [Brachyspira hyodysenteriae]MCZ9892183.1 DUF4234 domain-containing protein [Brachyspira hyodysenteriae]MCZ9989732.1 DUF4234 domain-containing protein [Brachyspira hyodysenteriae]MCZ9998098.1 DUF4234 domain-containing protein [Brachyspira hyodysenteriae]MDA0001531.1 DUF4234 domain-containing protein [Brachyspira hyodysenteriae]MDA0006541.1 DUF4234 domain-containing protein [Brachyspira hyodysenteriae]
MKKGTIRPIPIMLLLNIVTCGIYYIYWIYQTSVEIKISSEREDLNPTLEILLGIITCGLYFKYWYYKYGKIVYKELPLKAGMNNTEDKTVILVVIDIIIALMWWGGIILRTLLFAITYAVGEYTSDEELIYSFLYIIPSGLIYAVNISSLIMQDKLNNIWKHMQ